MSSVLATIGPEGNITLGTLQQVLGSELLDCQIPASLHKAEYSGALIVPLPLNWRQPPSDLRPASVLLKYVDTASSVVGFTEAKKARTIRSYTNEAIVLQHLFPALAAAGIRVPKLYCVETETSPTTRLLVVMECCRPQFVHMPMLDSERSYAALRWLARFHAFSVQWRADTQCESMGLWEPGGHTSLAQRPPGELQGTAAGFAKFRASFAACENAEFVQPEDQLGERLQAVAERVDGWLGQVNSRGWRVLVHGDYKSANIFIDLSSDEICVIDWQWTGWNVAMHDLIYYLSTSAPDEHCEQWQQLVLFYHSCFVEALPAQLREQRHLWPLDEQLRLFRLATLDYMRWGLSYRLPDETPAKLEQRASADEVDVNQGEYRRSFRRLSWLLQLVERFLPGAENEQDGVCLLPEQSMI